MLMTPLLTGHLLAGNQSLLGHEDDLAKRFDGCLNVMMMICTTFHKR